MAYLNRKVLESMGFKKLGSNVLISDKSSIYGASDMEIGDNVRIDDFCILSGNIILGSHIHISAYSALYGKDARIEIMDYSGVSPRSTIFSGTDDFSGEFVLGALAPDHLRNVSAGPVIMERYSQLGASSIVMPSCTIGEGTITGAFTFVVKDLKPWGMYAGIPAKIIKERKKDLLKLLHP